MSLQTGANCAIRTLAYRRLSSWMQGGWESFNVGFSPDEEEKTSTSLGNKIYRNDIPRRNSINHTKGHKSKQFYSKKQETDGRIGICSSRLTAKRTRLNDISDSACHLLWLSKSLYLYHDLDDTQWNSLHYPCFGLHNDWDGSFSCGFLLCLVPSRSEIYG